MFQDSPLKSVAAMCLMSVHYSLFLVVFAEIRANYSAYRATACLTARAECNHRYRFFNLFLYCCTALLIRASVRFECA